MIFSQAAKQRCVCCNNVTASTSFSFVITYYIFQKQIKSQSAIDLASSSQHQAIVALAQ